MKTIEEERHFRNVMFRRLDKFNRPILGGWGGGGVGGGRMYILIFRMLIGGYIFGGRIFRGVYVRRAY